MCTALKVDSIEEFHHHINSVEETIQFTMEEESDGRLAFLDTEIIHHGDGSLTTKVYRKKTHTNKYLSFKFHHPLVHKNSCGKNSPSPRILASHFLFAALIIVLHSSIVKHIFKGSFFCDFLFLSFHIKAFLSKNASVISSKVIKVD